ncbi:hypothetical protein ACHAQA_009756 [Verticillium albo-atrum]
MASKQKTIAFIGAAGVTLSRIIALSLKAGHRAVALARTPSKLLTTLESTFQIPTSVLDANLTTIQGSARDLAALKDLLRHDPDFIITGLTSTGDFHFNPLRPVTMKDPTLIGDSATLVLRALYELKAEGALASAPLFVPISSTGIATQRDLPLIMGPLYKWLLPEAVSDTKVMETVIAEDVLGGKSPLGGYVFEQGPGPAIGYTISRADLAEWIFEEVVQARREWAGKCATLAY